MFRTAQKLNRSDPDTSNNDVLLGDKELEQKSLNKYLGVYLDEHSPFKEHSSKLFKYPAD